MSMSSVPVVTRTWVLGILLGVADTKYWNIGTHWSPLLLQSQLEHSETHVW